MRPLQLLKLQCHPGKCDGDCQVCKFACPRATNENAIFQFFCNATNRDTTLVDCVTIIVIWLGWPELNLDCGRLTGLQSNYDMLSSHVHNRLNCDDIQTNVMVTVGIWKKKGKEWTALRSCSRKCANNLSILLQRHKSKTQPSPNVWRLWKICNSVVIWPGCILIVDDCANQTKLSRIVAKTTSILTSAAK